MAARKSRLSTERPSHTASSEVEAADPVVTPHSTLRELQITRRSPRVAVALGLFLVWAAGLATLAVVVPTPVTLNRVQIQEADVIVEGTLGADDEGVCQVSRSWPKHATDAQILVEKPSELSLKPNQSYLIPLKQTADGAYEIVLTPQPTRRALVYPATEEAIASLEALLSGED